MTYLGISRPEVLSVFHCLTLANREFIQVLPNWGVSVFLVSANPKRLYSSPQPNKDDRIWI